MINIFSSQSNIQEVTSYWFSTFYTLILTKNIKGWFSNKICLYFTLGVDEKPMLKPLWYTKLLYFPGLNMSKVMVRVRCCQYTLVKKGPSLQKDLTPPPQKNNTKYKIALFRRTFCHRLHCKNQPCTVQIKIWIWDNKKIIIHTRSYH